MRRRAGFYVRGADGVYCLAPIKGGRYHSVSVKGLWIEVDWLWQKPLPSAIDVLRAWKVM